MQDKYHPVSKYLETSLGVNIHYSLDDAGQNKTWLIFLHGLGGDEKAWDKERIVFSELGYSSVAIDLRGHGLSDAPKSSADYELPAFAQDVVQIIRKEKIESAVVIGHCFGGMISLYLADTGLTELKALILVDTSYRPTLLGIDRGNWPTLSKVIKLLAYAFPHVKPRAHEDHNRFSGTGNFDIWRLRSDISSTSLRSYMMCCSKMLDFDASDFFEMIHVPTLVICGNEDRVFPPHISEKIAGRIHKSILEIIPGANHIIVINNPDELIKSITAFLKRDNL